MSHYRRSSTDGCIYFFTLVSCRRQNILCDGFIRNALHKAIKETRLRYPFTIDAWILLPDHMHCIWTLPENDNSFSKRWGIIKRKVSITCADKYKKPQWITQSRQKHRESTIWQRRYWEHRIRNQGDFNKHVDYIHYNPVKHGLCSRPVDWPYSTFHRYVKEGLYPADWAVQNVDFEGGVFGE
ncbi:MAG: transposase [Gammaproteobacteria bacterium]